MRKQAVAAAMMVLVAPGVFAGKPDKQDKADDNPQDVITLQTVSVIADEVEAANVGTSTLSQDQIETRQANSVQELLDTLPAASLVGSPRAGGQTINIQGFGSMNVEHVQLRLDGAPKMFRKYQQGSLFLEPELLKSVEVGKGPHSSMNGNGGFGGVVNMKTKDAKDLLKPGQTVGGMVKTGFHSNNNLELYSGSVYAGGKDNPYDVLVNITKRRAGNLKDGDGNTFNYSGMNFLSGLAKVGYDFGNGHEISLTHISGKDASRVPWAAKGGLFDKHEGHQLYRRTVWRETDDKNTIFKHQFTSPAVEWLNTDLTVSYVDTKQHDTRPEDASKYAGSNMGNESWTHYKTLFAEFKNNQLIETNLLAHNLTYGIQYHQGKQDTLMVDLSKTKKDEYNHGLYQPWYMPSGKQTTMSAFFQDEVSWNDLTITPSLRYDHIVNQGVENLASRFNNPAAGHDYGKKSYSGFSPKLGLFYQLAPETSLFANYSYSFKAPTIREQYSVASEGTKGSATSMGLTPEKVYAARVGAITSFNNILTRADRLQVRSALFNTRVEDNIDRRLGEYFEDHAGQNQYANKKGYTIQGIEAELYYDAPRIFATLNFSIMTSKYNGTPRDPNGPDVPVNEVPPAEVNMGLGYKLYEHNMRFGWQAKYAHKTGRTAEDIDPNAHFYTLYKPTPSYMINHLFWDWEPKAVDGLKLQFFVENLFDRKYTPYLSEGVPGMGRNFKATATMKF